MDCIPLGEEALEVENWMESRTASLGGSDVDCILALCPRREEVDSNRQTGFQNPSAPPPKTPIASPVD